MRFGLNIKNINGKICSALAGPCCLSTDLFLDSEVLPECSTCANQWNVTRCQMAPKSPAGSAAFTDVMCLLHIPGMRVFLLSYWSKNDKFCQNWIIPCQDSGRNKRKKKPPPEIPLIFLPRQPHRSQWRLEAVTQHTILHNWTHLKLQSSGVADPGVCPWL